MSKKTKLKLLLSAVTLFVAITAYSVFFGNIAGLAADGITVVDDIYYIQRGYEELASKLRGIGAQIEKVTDEKELQKFILKVS